MEESEEESSKSFSVPGRLEQVGGVDVPSDLPIDAHDEWPKKRGRKRVTEVVHIINPRVNPALEFRSRDNDDEMPGVSRVFVGDPGSGMHFDWPIHSIHPLRVRDVITLILTNGHSLADDQICRSVPQEYTETGVFVVDVRQLGSLSQLLSDGLGVWGDAQTSCTFYNSGGERMSEEMMEWSIKVVCEKLKHPGTESHGHFYKTVYSGVLPSGESCPLAVICYQWEGQPHPITVHDAAATAFKSSRSRGCVDLSMDTGESWGAHPLFSHSPLDFDAVSRILLGALHVQPHRISSGVPLSFRGTGSFLVDVDKAGGEKSLHSTGGGRWAKPSGASRFFRSEADGNWMRVEKGGREGTEEEWHVQITSKRYESESDPGLMRKIFVVRERAEEFRAPYAGLAVVTFYWKNDVKPSRELNASIREDIESNDGKRRRIDDHAMAESGVDALSLSSLRRLAVEREAENLERFGAVLSRFEAIAHRYEEMLQGGGVREEEEGGE